MRGRDRPDMPHKYVGDTQILSYSAEINRLVKACGGKHAWIEWMSQKHPLVNCERMISIVQDCFTHGNEFAAGKYGLNSAATASTYKRRMKEYLNEMKKEIESNGKA